MYNQNTVCVTIRKGKNASSIIAYLQRHQILVRNIRYTDKVVKFDVAYAAIPTLRKARQQYRTTVKIRYVYAHRPLQKNIQTGLGILLLLLIPIICDQWMWQIDVQASTPEQQQAMQRYVDEQLAPPILKTTLPPDDDIRALIMRNFDGLSWTHVTKKGSQMVITPQLSPKNEVHDEQNGYAHLMARTSGVVTHFNITSGERKVRPNQTVYKGDTLVSGVLTQGDKQFLVGAKGEVYADYWIESSFTIPITIHYEAVVDEQWTFALTKDVQQLSPKMVQLPKWLARYIYIERTDIREKRTETLTESQIATKIVPLVREKLVQSLSKKGTIKEVQLLEATVGKERITGKVLFLVNDNIAQPYSISQGE